MSEEGDFSGYYLIEETKIESSGKKAYYCQRNAALKAIEYVTNTVR